MIASGVPSSATLERRVSALLRAADLRGTGLAPLELVDLLPATAPSTEREIADWLKARPALASIRAGRVFASGRVDEGRDVSEFAARTAEYAAGARRMLDGSPLGPPSWLLTVAITGSTAYGSPAAGEDCDFFAVTRDGTLWLSLLGIYLGLRFRGPRPHATSPSAWCFNYALEASAAAATFAERRGFLFAREALTAVPIRGERFYRGLLATASWMEVEAPRLYAQRSGGVPAAEVHREPPAPLPARLLNLALFPFLAAYLQLTGIYTNWKRVRQGRGSERFTTVTGRRLLAIRTRKFERLEQLYEGSEAQGFAPPSPGRSRADAAS